MSDASPHRLAPRLPARSPTEPRAAPSGSEVADELKSFGLSTYEAASYYALLLAGPSEAGAIASKANVPSGRVYDVLNALVEKSLAQVQDGRPKLYRALTPRVALANLLSLKKRESDERYESLTRLASDIEKRLAPRVKDKTSGFYAVSIGESDGRVFLTEKVKEARTEILVNLEFKRYDPADVALFTAFEDAVKRGVRVRVLVRDEEIPYIVESPYNQLIADTMIPHLGTALDVRIIKGEQVPFGVIDQEKALVAVKNPLDPAAYFALVFVWDPAFGRDLHGKFEELWRGAEADLPMDLAL